MSELCHMIVGCSGRHVRVERCEVYHQVTSRKAQHQRYVYPLSTSPSSLSLTLSTYISLLSFPNSVNTCLIGMGATTPGSIVTLDNGCEVPMGPGVEDSTSRTSLLYNEYIVYDTSQINIKYLFQLKFNYKTSSRRRR